MTKDKKYCIRAKTSTDITVKQAGKKNIHAINTYNMTLDISSSNSLRERNKNNN